jgi:hypothetical protein
MADVYPPVRQRPALLAFAEPLSSASTALRRDDHGDWRIKGRLGFICAVPRALHGPGREDSRLYCDPSRRMCQGWRVRIARHPRGFDFDDLLVGPPSHWGERRS